VDQYDVIEAQEDCNQLMKNLENLVDKIPPDLHNLYTEQNKHVELKDLEILVNESSDGKLTEKRTQMAQNTKLCEKKLQALLQQWNGKKE